MKFIVATIILSIIFSVGNLVLSDYTHVQLGKEKYYMDNIDKQCYEEAVCMPTGLICPQKFNISGPQLIEYDKSECEYYTDKNNRFYVRKFVLVPVITHNVVPLLLFLTATNQLSFGIILIIVTLPGLAINCYCIYLFEQYFIEEIHKIINYVVIMSSILNCLCVIFRIYRSKNNVEEVYNEA